MASPPRSSSLPASATPPSPRSNWALAARTASSTTSRFGTPNRQGPSRERDLSRGGPGAMTPQEDGVKPPQEAGFQADGQSVHLAEDFAIAHHQKKLLDDHRFTRPAKFVP